MRVFIALVLLFLTSHAKTDLKFLKLQKGQSIETFCAQNKLDSSIAKAVTPEHKKIVFANKETKDAVLVTKNGVFSELHILLETDNSFVVSKNKISRVRPVNKAVVEKFRPYSVKITKTLYKCSEKSAVFAVKRAAPVDFSAAVKDPALSYQFGRVISSTRPYLKFQKKDVVGVYYFEKRAANKRIEKPLIKAVYLKRDGREKYIFLEPKSGKYYADNGECLDAEGLFLSRPVNFKRVGSGFSLGRSHPLLGYIRPHYGIDFIAPVGTQVKAVGDGSVEFVGYERDFGNIVKLQHKMGYETYYAHLQNFAPSVQAGSYVKKGDVIGYLGGTGLATGPHLHFELRNNAQPKNPKELSLVPQPPLSKDEMSGFKLYLSSIGQKISPELTRVALLEQKTDEAKKPIKPIERKAASKKLTTASKTADTKLAQAYKTSVR